MRDIVVRGGEEQEQRKENQNFLQQEQLHDHLPLEHHEKCIKGKEEDDGDDDDELDREQAFKKNAHSNILIREKLNRGESRFKGDER